ncbi:hypothetical protein P4S91_15060 [Aneurinibacillus aneurinilyticus]|uniref:hypothetical protein n=1 Tax=Aneurinibacillus aneurinilyticus TaxID=1391 RepID=UPI002E217C33|nr:hypothetical protein [Aneurinibacillus aneurinilyticus]
MIIQYAPEWIITTPCPKRASVRLLHGSIEGRFLPWPGGTAKHLGRREEGDNCRPLSPGRGRSGLGATKRPCLFLVRKRRGNTPTRAPSFFPLMDNQQV